MISGPGMTVSSPKAIVWEGETTFLDPEKAVWDPEVSLPIPLTSN